MLNDFFLGQRFFYASFFYGDVFFEVAPFVFKFFKTLLCRFGINSGFDCSDDIGKCVVCIGEFPFIIPQVCIVTIQKRFFIPVRFPLQVALFLL